MLTVQGAPPSRTIAVEVAVNIAGAALRKRSGIMRGQSRVNEEERKEIVRHATRWLEHGFDPYARLIKDTGNAYRILNPGDTTLRRENLNVTWQTSFLMANKELSELFNKKKVERDPEKLQKLPKVHQTDSAQNFFSTYQEFKGQNSILDEDVYALEEAAYQTSIYKRGNMVFPRPKKQDKGEERQFSSVIHCCSSRGEHLLPYIVCRSKDPPQTKTYKTMQIASNETGWSEQAHTLDWLRTVFEPKTRPQESCDGSFPWRILLVSRRFGVRPEFEQYCWKRNILCLQFPDNDQKFFNPMWNIIFEAMKQNYTDTMLQKLLNKPNIAMGVEYFARWIQAEVNSSKRKAEATDRWLESCLIPADERRFRNHLQGKRATAMPDETDWNTSRELRPSRTRSESSMTQTPRTSCSPMARSTPRTSVPLPILPTTEIEKRDESEEQSDLQLHENLQDNLVSSSMDYTESDSASNSESGTPVFHVSQSVTPSRTSRRPRITPKTPKSALSKVTDLESHALVMSADQHIKALDGCIEGTPCTQKRFRDDLILDRGGLEKENARLKAQLDILRNFMPAKKQRTE
ncbi:uncharacterized protein N7511_002518 [Penicillium nucicola]|uniref:uncharacterized protein n=1 Tax=Penicillium nucicola TaxID=1850975 RepID=UPI0025451648|nr:uncharacterized protein N7511_002518 [Penicillium nucicola]KAJ5770467.1 hypothetical protein N7511_002518 [Penicillium nucicola]